MTLLTKSGQGRFFVFIDFVIAAFCHQIILSLELSTSKSFDKYYLMNNGLIKWAVEPVRHWNTVFI